VLDFLRACRAGARTTVATFRTRRSDAHEDPGFLSVWDAIDSVDGWLSRREAELLFLLAGSVQDDHAIVEIGSYCGRSTSALGFGTRSRRKSVYAVDPHTGDRSQVEAGLAIDTFDTFLETMKRLGLTGAVVPVRTRSVEAAEAYQGPKIGLLFVDGWHSAEAVIQDVKGWSPYFAPDPIVVFDDFQFPEVAAGIAEVRHLLPPPLGSVGKDLVFGSLDLKGRTARLKEILNASLELIFPMTQAVKAIPVPDQ
jgi:MMP 1-O-methyltransferase